MGSNRPRPSGPTRPLSPTVPNRTSRELLQIDILRRGADMALVLSGELDLSAAPLLRAAFDRVMRQGCDRLLLDLAGLRFLDATGLELIWEMHEYLGDRLQVRPGIHDRVLGLAGLDTELELVNEVRRAQEYEVSADNIAFARRMYAAWRAGGVAELARMVPAGVQWLPTGADGPVLAHTEELLSYWKRSGAVEEAAPTWFTGVDGDVIIETTWKRRGGMLQRTLSLCEFDGRRLVRALTVPDADSTTPASSL